MRRNAVDSGFVSDRFVATILSVLFFRFDANINEFEDSRSQMSKPLFVRVSAFRFRHISHMISPYLPRALITPDLCEENFPGVRKTTAKFNRNRKIV